MIVNSGFYDFAHHSGIINSESRILKDLIVQQLKTLTRSIEKQRAHQYEKSIK